MKKCLILANGEPPDKYVINYLNDNGYSKLICADGGANSARKMNIVPDYIIGDLDSILKENLDYFSKQSEIIELNRQSDTDVEKAIKFAIGNSFDEVILLGVMGNRLDHSFSNLSIAVKFSDRINIKIISGLSILSIVSGEKLLKTFPEEIISIYAFDEKTLITTRGLKYELNSEPLQFGKRESTSNVATGSEFYLMVENGTAFLIRDFEALRKHDLF